MRSNASRHLVDVKPSSVSRLERLATEYKRACADAAALEAKKKELSAKLLRITEANGEPDNEGKIRAESDSWQYVVVEAEHTSIDPKKLLQYGVSAKIIKRSTVKKPYKYVSVSKKKEEGETE